MEIVLIVDKNMRGLFYFLAAQIQAATFILGGYWGGKELDKSYPMAISWLMVIMPLAIVVIVHTFYTVIRFMLNKSKK